MADQKKNKGSSTKHHEEADNSPASDSESV